MTMPVKRIDTHAHFIPSFYRDACVENGHKNPDGMPAIPQWSEYRHLELMNQINISKSILSISSPGTYLKYGDLDSAVKLTRMCNNFAAALVSRNPEKFGFWASLPLPDVKSSLAEIKDVFDTPGLTHADGVIMETNHHGIYLGDPSLDPIFNELNRRRAKVFIHPTTPCLPSQNNQTPLAAAPLSQIPNPMFEFMFDTARSLINLFLSGTISRCPNITFIIPHAGAALPPIIERFTGFSSLLGTQASLNSQTVRETFSRQFYFDVAGLPFPDQLHGLLRFVGKDRLLYGSDFPFTPEQSVVRLSKAIDEGIKGWGKDEIDGLQFANAERLLVRAKQHGVL